MDINEIANDIMKNEDNQLARAFTMTVGRMLTSKGIHPIVIKSPEHWVTDDDINSYIIRKEYNVTFDIDTTEHDKQIRKQVIKEIEDAMYHQCFECDNDEDMQKWDSGNWIRYKLFENVLDSIRLKDMEM